MPTIERLSGREILDSRGRPTVLATCVLKSGLSASASVPSGASTGTAEAFELRDGDCKRYQGLGCRRAVANIGGALNTALAGRDFKDQAELDRAMIELDGTANKSRLGANAILAVSVAYARAEALQRGYRFISISPTCSARLSTRCLASPSICSVEANTRGSKSRFRMS